jgi:hypothetical protein
LRAEIAREIGTLKFGENYKAIPAGEFVTESQHWDP